MSISVVSHKSISVKETVGHVRNRGKVNMMHSQPVMGEGGEECNACKNSYNAKLCSPPVKLLVSVH